MNQFWTIPNQCSTGFGRGFGSEAVEQKCNSRIQTIDRSFHVRGHVGSALNVRARAGKMLLSQGRDFGTFPDARGLHQRPEVSH